MATLTAIGARCAAAWTLALAPRAAHGALHAATSSEPDQLHRYDPVTIEFEVDVDTSLDTFEFTPDCETVGDILQLVEDPTPRQTLAAELRSATLERAPYYYLPAKSVSKGTVAARWKLRVKGDAPMGPLGFDLDLFVNGEHVRFPESMHFNVVPQPPIWLVLIAGLAAVGARTYRRGVGVSAG